MQELKPCPHCGGEADAFRRFVPGDDYTFDMIVRVECEFCGASGKAFPVSKDPCDDAVGWDDPDVRVAHDSAAAAWNLRRADSEYESLLKRVLEAVADLKTLCHPEEETKDDSVATSQR